MVRLEELEDEHFVLKPEATADGALLADDDEDYTDTGLSLLPMIPDLLHTIPSSPPALLLHISTPDAPNPPTQPPINIPT